MKKLTNMDKSPACEYCHYGRVTADEKAVLCEKRGIMRRDSSCRSFKYDVLKRQPRKPLPLFGQYTEEDFKL